MSDIRDWLRDGDPVVAETPPSPEQFAQVLQQVRANAVGGEHRRVDMVWGRGWRVAALAACVAAVVLFLGIRERQIDHARMREALAPVRPEPVRQLYFATPDGTRVIWTFNPTFPE